MRIRRRNIVWLSILGGLTALTLVAPGVPIGVAAAIGLLFVGAAVATLIEIRPGELAENTRSSLLARRMSAEAREAADRARRRLGRLPLGLTMLDVGLITMHSGRDGVTMRRTRSASKDEDGIRPFITVFASPQQAEKQAIVRWEMVDSNGATQYIHEMKHYLRDGENNIVADHHLPLADNQKLQTSGEWELRMYIDGALLGAHTFTIIPTYAERFPRLARQQAVDDRARAARETLRADGEIDPPPNRRIRADDDAPMSLEDLLRGGASTSDTNGSRSSGSRSNGRH